MAGSNAATTDDPAGNAGEYTLPDGKVPSANPYENLISRLEDQIEGLDDVPLDEAQRESEGDFYVQGDEVVVANGPVFGGKSREDREDPVSDEVGGSMAEGRDLDDFEESSFVDGDYLNPNTGKRTPSFEPENQSGAAENAANNWRIRPNSEEDAQVLAMMKQGMTAIDSVAALQFIAQGKTDQQTYEQQQEALPPEMPEGIAPTTEAIDQAVLAATDALEIAEDDWDKDEAKAQIDRIRELNRLRSEVARFEAERANVAARAQSAAQEQFLNEMRTHGERVQSIYPDSSNPNSVMAQAMRQLDQVWEETGDPRFHDPRKPLLLAGVIAPQIKISPRLGASAQQAPSPTVLPGKGGGRGTPPASSSGSPLSRLNSLPIADRVELIDELIGY